MLMPSIIGLKERKFQGHMISQGPKSCIKSFWIGDYRKTLIKFLTNPEWALMSGSQLAVA